MFVMSKRKGSSYERELLSLLHDSGFSGVRVAGSGSSKFPSPDIVAGRSGSVFAIEVKATSSDFVYISNDQIGQLLGFASNFGCSPLIGVKFIGFGWRFFPPVKEVDKKNTCFHKNDSLADFQHLFENVL